MRGLFRRGLLGLVLLAGWRCTDAEAAALSPLLRDLARTAGQSRSIAPRLSISRAYAPCRESPPPGDGTVTRHECPPIPATTGSLRRVRRVSQAAQEAGVEPGALHASALIELLWAGEAKPLDRSIQSLHTAARLSDSPAPLLADLAGAYLLRAERMQTPGDLDRALEAAEEAVELDSANLSALYNRALALERIGLAEQADDAWKAYLRADDDSGWADEARAWVRHSVTVDVTPPKNPTLADAAAFARRMPQQANTWGWETLLPAWAAAYQAGNPAVADSALRLAEAAGRALVSAGRDATLADAVVAIRRAAPAAAARLAHSHRVYGEARQLYEAGDRSAAEPLLAEAETGSADSPPLRLWAGVFRAATLAYMGNPRGEANARHRVSEIDSLRYPATAGRARWILGSTLSRGGQYDVARGWFSRAAVFLARAGEHEHVGSMDALAFDALDKLGAGHDAEELRQRGFQRLRPYRGSVWLHNQLVVAAERAQAAGLPRAALRFRNEDIAVAGRTGQVLYMAEAKLGRAGHLASLGRTNAARQEVRAARPIVERLRPFARPWFTQYLRTIQSEIDLRDQPSASATLPDSVIDFFQKQPARHLPAILVRAEARLAVGDTAGARGDLRHAAEVILEQGENVRSIPLRGKLFARARGIFDQLVLATLAAGGEREALEQITYARSVFAPFPRPGTETLRIELPPGYVGVQYAVVGDTLLTWSVAGDSIRLTRRVIDHDWLENTVEEVRSALEAGDGQRSSRGLSTLFDVLIRPVQDHLGAPGHRLVIVADGVLSAVPFPALYDSERRQHLIELRTPELVASLSGLQAPVEAKAPVRALVVADPAFDRAAYPGYARLPEAALEAAEVAALYPSRHLLGDRQADSAHVAGAIPGIDLLHFAGHAVLDDTRPERAFLLLAGRGSASRLTGEEIGTMDLRGVRLVVLSACETARSPDGRAGGLTGMAAAFHGAGAEGVLGSLWRVDDQLTRPLIVEFHRAYRSTGDAAAALRAAQLHLLRSGDTSTSSPAAWAGFIFTTR